MNNRISEIETQLSPFRELLRDHKLYGLITDIEDVRIFMEKHVYAVWDFMSLLKALQNELTCTSIPWKPSGNSKTARFINEIVLEEETDVNVNGIPKSHFEMYLDAMTEIGANTSQIQTLVSNINSLENLTTALIAEQLSPAVKSFLQFTFETIQENKTHNIAAAFTFGREDVIPDMFIQIIEQSKHDYPHFKYYLERHIELDGDDHGPLSLMMIEELCGQADEKWNEVFITAKAALKHRLKLWDEIAYTIEKNKMQQEARRSAVSLV